MDERTARFGRLFDDCYQPLLAYARRRSVESDADDVVAEVLTVAWRRLDDIPDGMELPWLYGVARRTLANHHRGAGRRLRLLDRLGREPAPGANAEDDGDLVRAALQRLRPGDAEILRLTAWEGLTTSELSYLLECSENAVALRLSRARRRLRDQLTGTGHGRTRADWKGSDV